MTAGPRCWTRWIWLGCNQSPYIKLSRLMSRKMRRQEIHIVVVRGLRCSMSITFSFSSTLRCAWGLARRFTLGKETFLPRNWWTRVNPCRSGIRRRGYRCRYSSSTSVASSLQTPYTKCTLAYSSWESGMYIVTSHCTLNDSTNWLHRVLSDVLQALLLLHEYAHAKAHLSRFDCCSFSNRCDSEARVWHFWLRIAYGIRSCSSRLKFWDTCIFFYEEPIAYVLIPLYFKLCT